MVQGVARKGIPACAKVWGIWDNVVCSRNCKELGMAPKRKGDSGETGEVVKARSILDHLESHTTRYPEDQRAVNYNNQF